MGSGAIVQVDGTPINVQLQNRSGAARNIVGTLGTAGSANSIRIIRYADGPSV